MTKLEIVLTAISSGLYILGTFQGSTIADEIDNMLHPSNELSPVGRFIMTWLWPYSTVRAMMENDDGE